MTAMSLVLVLMLVGAGGAPSISATQIETTTVTGPITGELPWEMNWTPAPAEHEIPMPDMNSNLGTILQVTWYWLRSTWFDGEVLDYWLVYQVGAAILGNIIGKIWGNRF